VVGIVKHDAAFFERADVIFVGMLVETEETSASSPELKTSPLPMRTWKMEGPPEIVEGIVMNVMTSCSLRPAKAREKSADGLDAVLRIARDADDRFVDLRNFRRATRRRQSVLNCITHGTSR